MILCHHYSGLGQVHRGSGDTVIQGPTTALSALSVLISTTLRVEDSVESLPSLHPCVCGPCGNCVTRRYFSAVTPRSMSSCRQPRHLWPALVTASATGVTVAQCPKQCLPATCRCQRQRQRHRHYVPLADEPGDHPPRLPLQGRTVAAVGARARLAVVVGRHAPCHVAPLHSLCLTIQHQIRTAHSNVTRTVGGVVSVAIPVQRNVATLTRSLFIFFIRPRTIQDSLFHSRPPLSFKLVVLGQNWARQCRFGGWSGQRRSKTTSIVPVIMALLVSFLVLPTATSSSGAGTTPAAPSFTPNAISNGGCAYAYQVRAVDVTADGFVDVLAGTNELGPCALLQWAAFPPDLGRSAVGSVQLVKEAPLERTQ